MPVPSIFYLLERGPPQWMRDYAWTIVYSAAAVGFLVLLKRYTSGRKSVAERVLHGKVVMMTGGTSGIGSQVAQELASRGAQLVLLTQTPASDPFLVEYIEDLRERSGNNLIYTEQVDLSSLHSIRKFATKWIDNAPPRRLDMIIFCAATMTVPGGKRRETEDEIEETWMVNYLANFHLLSILSPALKAQPVDRDVRIIMTTCSSYIGSPSLKDGVDNDAKNWSPGTAYARSKLALNVFGQAFQKHLDSYKRPDEFPMNARVIFVDPGLSRTPGMSRWLTRGSLWGLMIYLTLYIFPWFLLKSPYMAAQSILHAAMDASLSRGKGGKLIKECMEVDFARPEVLDDEVAKKLWEESDKLIEASEKKTAKRRANMKAQEEKDKDDEKQREQVEEVESLMEAIKKGKEKEKQQQQKKKSKTGNKGNKQGK